MSITETDPDEFGLLKDMARACRVIVQVAKGTAVHRAMALNSYLVVEDRNCLELEFDALALEALGVDKSDGKSCLEAVFKAPWQKLQVHTGSFGEAVFLVNKPTGD